MKKKLIKFFESIIPELFGISFTILIVDGLLEIQSKKERKQILIFLKKDLFELFSLIKDIRNEPFIKIEYTLSDSFFANYSTYFKNYDFSNIDLKSDKLLKLDINEVQKFYIKSTASGLVFSKNSYDSNFYIAMLSILKGINSQIQKILNKYNILLDDISMGSLLTMQYMNEECILELEKYSSHLKNNIEYNPVFKMSISDLFSLLFSSFFSLKEIETKHIKMSLGYDRIFYSLHIFDDLK